VRATIDWLIDAAQLLALAALVLALSVGYYLVHRSAPTPPGDRAP
jgi:hypothetical protein